MNIFFNKNDYSITVFDVNGNLLKSWQYVHGLYTASLSLNNLTPHWHYMNVYNRRSRFFMVRYYKSDFIPNKPKF